MCSRNVSETLRLKSGASEKKIFYSYKKERIFTKYHFAMTHNLKIKATILKIHT